MFFFLSMKIKNTFFYLMKKEFTSLTGKCKLDRFSGSDIRLLLVGCRK